MGKDKFTEEEGTEKLQAPPDFDGPVEHRKCTDVLCAVFLVAAWVAMSILGAYAVSNGDYRVIVYPMDYDGNICGTDFGPIDMTDYRYLYYVNSYSGGVCVKECPSIENLTDVFTAVTYGGIYQTENATLAPDAIQVANYSSSEDAKYCEDVGSVNSCYPYGSAQLSWTAPGFNRGWGYAYYALDTFQLLRRCIPNLDAINQLREETRWTPPEQMENVTNRTSEADWLEISDAGGSFWGNLFADLWTARQWILGFGFGVSLIVGFVYAFFLRIPGVLPFMVWGSLFLTIGFFFGIGYASFDYANRLAAENTQMMMMSSDRMINALRISAYVLWVVGALLLLLVCALRKQIQLAMGCVKEASRSISAMPVIILFPVLQATGFILFMVAFFYYGVYLASLGTLETNEYTMDNPFGDLFDYSITVRSFEYSDFVENSAWYLLFCFYWTTQFILAIGEVIVAMAIARWYFTRDKSTIGNGTVCRAICASCWYHTGTAAFGSLIIAIVKIIRSLIAKLQKKAEQINSSVAKVLFCCCQCCLWCFEKCIKFLNKNAYIQTAIFGTSFCKSAREAFFLILRNAARISTITFVSGGVTFIGKLFITTLTCGIAYFAFDEYLVEELHSPVGPIVFIGLIGYFVGGMFMNVFNMGISTILQCFVADEEMFGSASYAEGKLRKWVDESDEMTATPRNVTAM